MVTSFQSECLQSFSLPLKDRIPKLEPRRRRVQAHNGIPAPATPALPRPPDISSLIFKTPTRRIVSPQDHQLFLASPTHELILGWIFGLLESVVDTPMSSVKDADLGPALRNIVAILDEVHALLLDSPPDDQGGSRFGNKTFRVFLDKVTARLRAWHGPDMLGVADPDAAAEAATYLSQSFGNRARIDYGSGHELNFMTWLLCLRQLGILPDTMETRRAIVLRIYARYLSVMRSVQQAYYLEPAGSHGVWGLDDYQFLPFLFGSAQLLNHPLVKPRGIHSELTLEEFGGDYLYLGQVAFVNSTKTVRGLKWHSPMLDDISGARNWHKIEGGMRKMFVAEVLGKLPVMQHFLFGSLVPAADSMMMPPGMAKVEGGEGPADDSVGRRHVHGAVGWGECCGIKVPSSIGAAEEMRKRGMGGKQWRTIPFD